MGDHPQAAGRAITNTPEEREPLTREDLNAKLLARVHPAPEIGESAAAPRARLLLVDDDPEVRRSLARQLRARGYYVDVAVGGQEAVAYVDQTSYDVILSDIRMPHMDGIELLREVRRHDLNVPVVLLTGAPAMASAIQAIEHGVFRYLTKSADTAELEQVLDQATRLRRLTSTHGWSYNPPSSGIIAPLNRVQLETSLTECLSSFWLAYQPIVDVKKHVIHGYEALLRSSQSSLPHPGAVFDAAQRLGRLDELGRAIRTRASDALFQNPGNELLFINLHVTDLADPALTDRNSALSAVAERVVLEITERSSLDEVKDAHHRVARLRELGFRVAIDDMGSGYAGLTSFALLEPDYAKLDMSLVRDVELNPTKQKVILSMAALCRDLGIQVIAEGVETVEERDTLLELGCELLQGFLFAKPDKDFREVDW